jgi:predicted NUDIX family phosphoesterase
MMTENILVVKRSILLNNQEFQGLNTDVQSFITCINTHGKFLPRAAMEKDEHYKQIIPYLIFQHEDRYFMMQRKATSSEQRLKNKFSLGIGGHMRQEDMLNSATIFDWAKREFYEEVHYAGSLAITPLGVLNDDSNPVGRVHIGLILLLKGDSPEIRIYSELKSGTLMNPRECLEHYDGMESWSQIIFDAMLRPLLTPATKSFQSEINL